MSSVYKEWKIGDNSIRIVGDKYSHSCPISDLLMIIDVILKIYNEDTMLFKYKDIRNYLIENNIYNDSNFERNKYKITVTLNTLLLQKLIIKKSKKGPYQVINVNELRKFREEIEKQVTTK